MNELSPESNRGEYGTSRSGTGNDLLLENEINHALKHGIDEIGDRYVDSVIAGVRWTRERNGQKPLPGDNQDNPS